MLRSFVGRWASRGMIGLLATWRRCFAWLCGRPWRPTAPAIAGGRGQRPAGRCRGGDDAEPAAGAYRRRQDRGRRHPQTVVAASGLMLYTDLPLSEEVDRLPEVFDQAFPQWCDYFHVRPPPRRLADDGLPHQGQGPLRAAGPAAGRPAAPFGHGYPRNDGFWLYEQPSDYYRRHLLLHEGTHGFMNTLLGGCGPPWYMEGMAELLATHRLRTAG